MFGLVSDVTAKVSTDDAVPGGIVFLVKFLLDIGSNVLFDVVLGQSCCGTVHRFLLHVLGHVSVLDHRFLGVGHLYRNLTAINRT